MWKYKDYLKNIDIAYVDDDVKNTQKISELFENFFRSVGVYNNPNDFIESNKIKNYNLLVFDVCMQDYSGIDLVKIIRKSDKKVPIILLTAFSDENYLLESVNLNIQSYLIKPLNFEKLTLALRNVIDFLEITNNLTYYIDTFSFDRSTLQLTKNGKEILLNKKERTLLNLLITNIGKAVTYEEIENKIWDLDDEIMTQNALRTIIKTLRKKLDDTTLIKNISGYGYMLDNK